jgi:zinc D-Ala-D-Ala carboxypeptidase
MDALNRVETRIVDVQSRIAQMSGRRSVAPASTSLSPSSETSGSNISPFRELADAAQRSAAGGLSTLSSSGAFTSSASSAGSVTSAARKSPGSYGPITLPTAILGMKNGQLPAVALESIGQGEHRLERSAAVAFRRMETAAAHDGVTLTVSDSYRSLTEQQQTAANVGLYREGGLAAVPGTSSHGWGLSVDLDLEPRAQRWLRANADRFGFAEDVAREPWHYTYRPADM